MELNNILFESETDWYRWNEKNQSWDFNHRQRSWDDSEKEPTPISDLQKSAWKNAKWCKEKVLS
jgi:hypothetical protein